MAVYDDSSLRRGSCCYKLAAKLCSSVLKYMSSLSTVSGRLFVVCGRFCESQVGLEEGRIEGGRSTPGIIGSVTPHSLFRPRSILFLEWGMVVRGGGRTARGGDCPVPNIFYGCDTVNSP